MPVTKFRLNSPPVVAEMIDGEATIVDLDTGTYYALNESGSFVWDRLLGGIEVRQVASAVADRYGIDSEQATGDVESLLAELTERQLLAPLEEGRPAPTANGSPAEASTNGSYSPPKLSVYTDMQELLLLDPVHEVDDAGWPARP